MRAIIVLCCTIAGCGSQPQIDPQAYVQALQNQCRSYGFQPGTDAFAHCIQQEHSRVRDAAAAQRAGQAYRDAAYYCNRGVAAACQSLGR